MPLLAGRLERPETVVLGAVLGAVAAMGWLAGPLVLALAIGLQLAIGGLGSVAILGPARPGLGVARYLSVPLGGVALTLVGRILPPGLPLLEAPMAVFVVWAPLAALLSWGLVELEVRRPQGAGGALAFDLFPVGILFAATAGLYHLFGADAWPSPLALVAPIAFVLALRVAEGRSWGGARAVGRASLHALGVAQVAAAAILLELPGSVAPALVALAFYAWTGAADALEARRPLRELLEFAALAVLGIVVAFLLHLG